MPNIVYTFNDLTDEEIEALEVEWQWQQTNEKFITS